MKTGVKSTKPGSVRIAKSKSFRARYMSFGSKKRMGKWVCLVVIDRSCLSASPRAAREAEYDLRLSKSEITSMLPEYFV